MRPNLRQINMKLQATLISLATVYAALPDHCGTGGNIALTFDHEDPNLVKTDSILLTLKTRQVSAAFEFMSASLTDPTKAALARRSVTEGHLVGLRSDSSWGNLSDYNYSATVSLLNSSMNTFETAMGYRPTYIRLTVNQYDNTTVNAAKALGMDTIMYNLDSYDYNVNSNPATKFEILDSKMGYIAVFRNTAETADHLNSILDNISANHLTIVRLDRCNGAIAPVLPTTTATNLAGPSSTSDFKFPTMTTSASAQPTETTTKDGSTGDATSAGSSNAAFALLSFVVAGLVFIL